MMNDILIVGNGYDLAKGLNTRFSDFFLPVVYQYVVWIEEKNIGSLLPETEELCSLIKKHLKEFSDQKVCIKDKDTLFNNIFVKIILNSFFPFINVLDSLVSVNEKLLTIFNISSYFSRFETINSNPNMRSVFDEISKVKNILRNTKANKDYLWMDVESLVKDIVTGDISKIPVNSLYEISWKHFYQNILRIKNDDSIGLSVNGVNITKYESFSLEDCLDGLNMFKDLFCDYLEKEEKKYRSDAPKKIFLKNKFSHIISLNYTSTFIDSLKRTVPNKIKQKDRMCFVHGDRESKNIVIGTESFYFEENSRSETNIEKIPFFKFFQKVLNKTDDKYLQWLEEDEFSLTFFGFSFSQNDFDFIRELFINDDGNASSTNQGMIRKHLKSITIYCKTEKDQFFYLVNLAACLGKRHLSSIKSILNFSIIE